MARGWQLSAKMSHNVKSSEIIYSLPTAFLCQVNMELHKY